MERIYTIIRQIPAGAICSFVSGNSIISYLLMRKFYRLKNFCMKMIVLGLLLLVAYLLIT